MGSREKILANVSLLQPGMKPLPDLTKKVTGTTNLVMEFTSMLEKVGGKAVEVDDWTSIQDFVEKYYEGINRIVSFEPKLPWTVPIIAGDPHSFEDVDLAILQGHFGVAENAAVWITDELLGDRALPFITQHLALVIKKSEIVSTLHEAYIRIGSLSYNFGTFIAGPSKTADIEQSLVLGAHGPKSMIVFLMDGEL